MESHDAGNEEDQLRHIGELPGMWEESDLEGGWADSSHPNRHPSGMNLALSNNELETHWKNTFRSGKVSDTLASMVAKRQRLLNELDEAEGELRDWARLDIANARQFGRPAPKFKRDTRFDCGECVPCTSSNYDSDKVDTHCIDCNCLLCIPGG